MPDALRRRRWQRGLRVLVLTVLLSVASGYVLFMSVFPTVGFPASGEAPFALVLAVLAVAGLVAGFAAEELLEGVIAVVLALFGSILVAGAMSLAPLAEGLYLVDPGSSFGFLVRYGFAFLILTFIVYLVCVIVGYGLHERFVTQRPRTFAESVAMHRK